jgi:hypothetical protein
LIAADELTYVIGTTRVFVPFVAAAIASHAATASSYCAMSAIEQPAERSGRTTLTSSGVSTSAVSAMKCTPQKTRNSLPRRALSAAAIWLSFRLSPVRSAWRTTSSCW